jgi:hypothetical protein
MLLEKRFDSMGTRQFLPSWNRNNIPATRNEANEIVQALCGMHLFTHVDIAQLQRMYTAMEHRGSRKEEVEAWIDGAGGVGAG